MIPLLLVFVERFFYFYFPGFSALALRPSQLTTILDLADSHFSQDQWGFNLMQATISVYFPYSSHIVRVLWPPVNWPVQRLP